MPCEVCLPRAKHGAIPFELQVGQFFAGGVNLAAFGNSPRFQLRAMHPMILLDQFNGSFEHDQFAVAKAAAFSAIMTLFPAVLLIASILSR